METENLKTSHQKVAWILERVPATKKNYKLLLLLYWQIFDGIDISKETLRQIIENGTEPETVTRSKRRVLEITSNINALEDMLNEILEDESNKYADSLETLQVNNYIILDRVDSAFTPYLTVGPHMVSRINYEDTLDGKTYINSIEVFINEGDLNSTYSKTCNIGRSLFRLGPSSMQIHL